MARRSGRWARTKALSASEKTTIAATCDAFIDQVLKPRFLPEVRPTSFNYPVDIFGKWRGNKFSFITRYRSGFPETLGDEFDAPFTRLDHVDERVDATVFDVMWKRHTGQWIRLYAETSLEEALTLIETEGLLQPHT